MKTRRRIDLFKLMRFYLAHSYRACPFMFVALAVTSLLVCAVQVFEVIAMRSFFDSISLFASNNAAIGEVYRAAFFVAAVWLVGPIIEIGEYLSQGYFYRRGNGYIQSVTHLRVGKIKLVNFENNETFNAIQKAGLGNDGAPSASRTTLQFLFYYLPYYLFISFFLFTVKPVLVFVIALIFIPVLISQIMRASEMYNFEHNIAQEKRKASHFEACVSSREYLKETRTLLAFHYFFKLFRDAVRAYGNELLRVEKKTAKIEILLRSVSVLGYSGIIVIMLLGLVDGSISVGIFAAVYYSVEQITNVTQRMVDDLGELVNSMPGIAFCHDFIEKKEDSALDRPLEKKSDISLRGVSFAYPNSDRNVLSDINLTIRNGQTIAVVGENGAGKTTLTKIITGLLDPTEGDVFYGESDIGHYALSRRYDRISAVFQSFIRYKMTLEENIKISAAGLPIPVDGVMEKARVDISKHKNGKETLLSRDFGGTDISGGEWQRIALARGLYRECDVIVLDEPTASIDPVEEAKIFEFFYEISRGKTTVLVTHRMGSSKMADLIVVLDKGSVAESGTYVELMNKKGLYYEMFMEQSKWYVR